MGRPIMIDDGGSIRINFAEELDTSGQELAGNMDGLRKVRRISTTRWEAEEQEVKGHGGGNSYKFTKATFAWVTTDGIADKTDVPSFEMIEISTDNGQKVKLTRENTNNKLSIMVSSDSAEPIIESKSNKMTLGYVVVNGGRITQITLDNEGQIGGNMPIPPGAVYYGVIIS